MFMKLKKLIREWKNSEAGVAAVEASMIFPILMILLIGTYDMGNGILLNQKTIRASQMAADLVTRERVVNQNDINEAIEASRLAFTPFDDSTYGIDIVSIKFNENAQPQIVWRETRNMTPVTDVLARVTPLAQANNGVMVISVQYLFKPVFAGFIINNIQMSEIAFARGRKSAVVNRS